MENKQKEVVQKKNIIQLEQLEKEEIPEVDINPNLEKENSLDKKKLNEIILATLTIILGICYIIAEKTTWLEIFLLDYGTIDLEMIGWGIFDLTLTLSQVILIGGMFLLGLFYLLSIAVNKKPEKLQIYIENPDKTKKSKNL